MTDLKDLKDRVVLVVGASGVLGAEIARRLEEEGATVVRSGRDPARLTGPDAVIAELSDRDSPSALVEAAVAFHNVLDGVVIAAGVVAFGPAQELRNDTLEHLFAINTLAPIRVIREAVPYLTASATAGRAPFIVTISGIVAESPSAGLAAYSASKSALAAFVRASSRELRRSGIRMLDARPGHTETGLATRAIAGSAPVFAPGLAPSAVADRIVRGILDDERDLPSTAF